MGSKAARILSVLLVFCMVTAFMLTGVPTARAADDDFSATYTFYPVGLGYLGGDTRLILRVTNNGATNITEVNAVINLETACSKYWSGTILPGEEKKIVFDGIHFSGNDVNVQRVMTVSINNDSDANPDGMKIFKFTMQGADPLWSVSYSITPSRSTLHPGDTIAGNVTVTNINSADGMILEHMNVEVSLNLSGAADDHYFPATDYGSLDPGESVVSSFSYRLMEDDITDRLLVRCNVKCSLAGLNYGKQDYSSAYTVVEAPRPTVTNTETPATATVSATEQPTPEPSPTLESPTLTEPPTLTPMPSSSPLAKAADTQPSQGIPTIVLFAVIAVLLLAIAVLLIMLLLRNKKTKQQ